ncbi:P-loop containing nucleoside triphosphate hydrolase protein [Cantharellus anzutake]|uniref:P-loop containing nucleoside triphosphate hydrolase protein n=1 Tax=Cantharellus anzutake TaxID=1750568 RepID=UPI0019085A8D|nr:P-loop containing nucleoside triphosphate hydrolase protein [Cantharellus anzutake]KAF8313517.1 P-loop containing nucleoside triphosphate hydrolase protein [Cantharellus anzutake]
MKLFNTVVLGAGGVGKSSLTIRYMQQVFVDTYDPTIEEAYVKNLVVDGEMCQLEILDTAGAGQFTAINEFYTRGQSGYILVFSLTSATSLREVESIRQQIFRSKGLPIPPLSYGIPFILVGTKSDLASEREVSRDVLMKVATLWRCPCYETSAKKDWNVQEVFMDIARQMKNTFPYGSNAPLEPVVPVKKKKRHFGCIIQ